MTRPLTTREVRRAYLNSTRAPRLSKAEERRLEREELERIREEERQERERARARVARERKRAREEEERAERRRRGEPVVPVRASQGMISGFFRRGGVGVGGERKGGDGSRRDAGVGGEARCEDQRDVREAGEGDNSGDGNQRNLRCGEAQTCAELGGQELDDLFLSASQLDREVGGIPQPPRKRSRDEAFRIPEPLPPKPPDRASPRPPTDPGSESYDLGVSSQELLQIEAQETERGCVRGEGRGETRGSPRLDSGRIPDGPKEPAELAESNVSFIESFDLSSQDLRELDALAAPPNHPAIYPTENLNPDTNSDTKPGDQGAGKGTPRKDTTGQTGEPRPSPTRGQDLVPPVETRSRATAEAEAKATQREAGVLPSPGNSRHPRPGDRMCGDGTGGATAGRTHGVTKGGSSTEGRQSGGLANQARTKAPRQARDDGAEARAASRRPLSPDLDDDEWWEDLDNTDLAALLECPA